jgi:hypothetical protein
LPWGQPLRCGRMRVGGADEGRCAGAVAIGIAAVLDGNSRTEAAKIGGMDRQTLRDWVISSAVASLDRLLRLILMDGNG